MGRWNFYSEGNLPVLKRWAITIVVRSWLSINLSKAAWTMRSLSESNAEVASSLCQDSVDDVHEQTHKYVKNCAIHDESLPSKRTLGFFTNARAIAIRSGIRGGMYKRYTR